LVSTIHGTQTIKLSDLGEVYFFFFFSMIFQFTFYFKSINLNTEENEAARSSTCTPSYTAPELNISGEISQEYTLTKADVWGIGCVLYQSLIINQCDIDDIAFILQTRYFMVLGHNPYEDEASRKNPPPPLGRRIPVFVECVLKSMVNSNWEQRISAAEVIVYLLPKRLFLIYF
jgi:serine/threonine protein kinase